MADFLSDFPQMEIVSNNEDDFPEISEELASIKNKLAKYNEIRTKLIKKHQEYIDNYNLFEGYETKHVLQGDYDNDLNTTDRIEYLIEQVNQEYDTITDKKTKFIDEFINSNINNFNKIIQDRQEKEKLANINRKKAEERAHKKQQEKMIAGAQNGGKKRPKKTKKTKKTKKRKSIKNRK